MAFIRKHIIIFIAFLIVGAMIASLYSPKAPRSGLGRFVVMITSPVQGAVFSIFDGISSAYYGYIHLWNARAEVKELRDINGYLIRQLEENEVVREENARLRRLLGFAERKSFHYIPAQVIATDILGQFHTVTINVGRHDGIRDGMPVVQTDGVVGRIVETVGNYSRVLLMIDPNSSIDGIVRRSGARGIIQGTSEREKLQCQFAFSLRTEEVRGGDIVETSGLDQQFPSGLVLGRITEVSKTEYGIFQEALVDPAVDFSRLREVLVVTGGGNMP